MGVFPGAGVREDVYARPPSSGVGTGPIAFTYGHLVALVLGDFTCSIGFLVVSGCWCEEIRTLQPKISPY